MVISPALVTELKRALTYPQVSKYLKMSADEIEAFIENLQRVATVVEPQITLEAVAADPDDNRVLECAVAGNAGYFVSGDRHLLDLVEYERIVILSPTQFMAWLEAM